MTNIFEQYIHTDFYFEDVFSAKTTLVKSKFFYVLNKINILLAIQSVQIPTNRGCIYSTFAEFFENYENCGSYLENFPSELTRCWRDDGRDWSLYE